MSNDDVSNLPLKDWTPRSQLRAAVTPVPRPAFPVVDIHNHLGRWLSEDGGWMIPDVDALLAMMDAHDVEAIVSLDGMWGDTLTEHLDRYDRAHPGRFVTFCQIDWALLAGPDPLPALLANLEDSAARGARGIKVWKPLGLHHRDASGALVALDDERVVAVLRRAGELGLPVLIHSADPIAFFEPLDASNERLDELRGQSDWWFGDRSVYPTFDELLDAHARLVLACPGTTFVAAHVGGAAEDLDRVERLLAAAPNYYVDIAGRMAELGRQPRRTAQLIRRFNDRVLFGTDVYPISAESYELHFRFLESADEGFSYNPGSPIPGQGRWDVSALDLAPELLPALYAGNARRILGLA